MRIKCIRFIKRLFKNGSVCVTGLKGTGKDLLTSNVVVRRKLPYASNIDYGEAFIPLRFEDIDCGGNTYKEFISGNVNYYEFPYPPDTDIYISDGGVYLPSQYCNELNKQYPSLPTFMALSRQVGYGKCKVHFNTQNLNRMWDKVREMSETYIRCNKCFYIFGFVFQLVTVYDKYQSCVDRVQPCRVRVPLFNIQARLNARIYRDNFFNTHGEVKRYLLFYRNKSSYDTLHFNTLLKNGVVNEKK